MRGLRRRRLLSCVLGVVVLLAGPAWAHDSDRPRAYLHLRGQDTNPWTGVHDSWGVAAGANFNRYVGAELASDIFEREIRIPGLGTLGEHGLASLVPQFRLRYPMLDGRLTPYLVGGVGVMFAEMNDRKPRALGRRVEVQGTSAVGTLGVGLEYFFADNLALGAEVKYILAENQTVRVDGIRYRRSIDTLYTTVGLRLFYPENRPVPFAEARDPVPTRLYVALRIGGAVPTRTRLGQGLRVRSEPPAYGDVLNQHFGAAGGVNVGRYLGAELAFEGYESVLALKGVGALTEYAFYALVPQVRVRYPLLGGRLVPYGIAGVGLATGEVNDVLPAGAGRRIRPTYSRGPAVALGGGIEYFVASNVAVGLESRYLHTWLDGVRVAGGPRVDPDQHPVSVTLGLRIFLADF